MSMINSWKPESRANYRKNLMSKDATRNAWSTAGTFTVFGGLGIVLFGSLAALLTNPVAGLLVIPAGIVCGILTVVFYEKANRV